jgi:hypothetical protein
MFAKFCKFSSKAISFPENPNNEKELLVVFSQSSNMEKFIAALCNSGVIWDLLAHFSFEDFLLFASTSKVICQQLQKISTTAKKNFSRWARNADRTLETARQSSRTLVPWKGMLENADDYGLADEKNYEMWLKTYEDLVSKFSESAYGGSLKRKVLLPNKRKKDGVQRYFYYHSDGSYFVISVLSVDAYLIFGDEDGESSSWDMKIEYFANSELVLVLGTASGHPFVQMKTFNWQQSHGETSLGFGHGYEKDVILKQLKDLPHGFDCINNTYGKDAEPQKEISALWVTEKGEYLWIPRPEKFAKTEK